MSHAAITYNPPEEASDESKARARHLCLLRKNKLRKEEREKNPGLLTLADLVPKDGRRFVPGGSNCLLRNQEFLISLILDAEGLGEAVPPEWREPLDHLAGKRARSRAGTHLRPAAVQAETEDTSDEIDVSDPARYAIVLLLSYVAPRQFFIGSVLAACLGRSESRHGSAGGPALTSGCGRSTRTALLRKGRPTCRDIQLVFSTSSPESPTAQYRMSSVIMR